MTLKIRSRCFKKAALLLPTGFADGEARYRTVSAEVCVSERRASRPTDGTAAAGHSVLLVVAGEPPTPGAKVLVAGREFELKTVSECRNLEGEVVAWRCTAL